MSLEKQLSPPADHGETSYVGSGKLAGRRALITGGDSGIGRAVAIAFAREGADVAIAYLDEHEDAAETVRWIEAAGRKAVAIPGDLATRDHCHAVVARAVEALGGLDLLVNNAADLFVAPTLADLTEDQLERNFRVNFFAHVWTSQAALPHMGAGAAIIATGSATGLDGHPVLLGYSASKAAIHNFAKGLAQQVAPRGIRVNAVAPGPVWTPIVAGPREVATADGFGAETVWGRPAQPAELAAAYVFLASDDARFFTGELLCPSGMGSTR